MVEEEISPDRSPRGVEEDDLDLASFEGKYPDDLFNKSVLVRNTGKEGMLGKVQMEGLDTIVVFGDAGRRYDIPKADITVSGGYVVLEDTNPEKYRVDKDTPLPAAKSLRPSAEDIRRAAHEQEIVQERRADEDRRRTRADMILREREFLARSPRPATVTTGTAGYITNESELSRKMRIAAAELRDLLSAGTKVAKAKVKKTRQKIDEKKAESDAKAISNMGWLAAAFADSFEDIFLEIRKKSYSEQERALEGFMRLIDSQREIVVAQRDMAAKLKKAVPEPVISASGKSPRSSGRRRLAQKKQPALPETVGNAAVEADENLAADIARPDNSLPTGTAGAETQ
ncbi:MAG TPA: hypothetical protein VFA15_01240 [Nitrososphaera sp.]|nr:hypothetical protein [Nitrososphaera sp.]